MAHESVHCWISRDADSRLSERESKIVNECTLPLTGKGVVNLIITNLGVFKVENGIKLIEFATNTSKEEIISKTSTHVEFPN